MLYYLIPAIIFAIFTFCGYVGMFFYLNRFKHGNKNSMVWAILMFFGGTGSLVVSAALMVMAAYIAMNPTIN